MYCRALTKIPALTAVLVLAIALPAFAQTNPATQAYGGPQAQGEVLGNFNGGGQEDVVPPPAAPRGEEAAEPIKPSKAVPVERGVDAPVPATATPSVTGQLPFTGFEAGLAALFGVMLLGTGFAMRRASRNSG